MTGCPNCIVFGPCGGHPEPLIYQVGCASYAGNKVPKDTDDMNPHFLEKFWELWWDVRGLDDYSVPTLLSFNPNGLPRYVPMLQGKHLRPSQPFSLPVVALPLFHVLGKRKDRSYGPLFPDAAALRAAYMLRKDTRILLIGVDHDRPLETFWAKHRSDDVCQSLARLGLEVTIPNFSFFTCVPRFQILRNRKRILLVAERLSQAGVRVSPHLNANTPGDWAFWLDFLQQHTEVTTVTMEFQTGARARKNVGDEAFRHLAATLARLPRPVHCLLIGAGRYYKAATQHLPAFTIVDSVPFIQATKRHTLVRSASGRYYLKKVPTHQQASLQALFEATLCNYETMLSKGPGAPRRSPRPDSKQPDLLY